MKATHLLSLILFLISTHLTAQTVCQEQLEHTDGVSGTSLGQSIFMAECSGFFTSLELYRSDNGEEITAELMILNGQTFLGTPRYTQTITIPQGEGAFIITLGNGTGDLSFFEDSQYTFLLSGVALELGASRDTNAYADGQLFQDVGFINNDDLWFRLSTSTTLGVQSQAVQHISLVPNPANGHIQLLGIDGQEAFTIYNMLGSMVMRGVVSENEAIDIHALPVGLYLLKLDGNQTLRFVKG